MYDRVSIDRRDRNRSRRSLSVYRAICATVTLATSSAVLVGCQTPQTAGTQMPGAQIPGTPHLPGMHSPATPQMAPGGRTPAMPGGHLSADPAQQQNQLAAYSGVDGSSTAKPTTQSHAVAQVGFIDRLRSNTCGRGNGQVCADSSQCVSCQGGFMPVMGTAMDPQEFLCNGGDQDPQARVLRDDSVTGLQPQDAIVHYTTEAGDIHIQESNRVCLYSPRFGSVRQVSGAVAGEKAVGLRTNHQPVGPNGIGLTQPSLIVEDVAELAHANVAKRIDAMRDRNRGVRVDNVLQPMVAADVLQILATLDSVGLNRLDESQILVLQKGAVAAQSWMIRDAVEVMIESMQPPVLIRDARVESFVEYDFPDAGRLQIVKVADKQHAQQGDEVSFAIHVQNVGDSPVSNIEIADSLVARLEFVEGSEKCDREASFESNGNAAGSLRLKWTLADTLDVGESAKIEFKCRVR